METLTFKEIIEAVNGELIKEGQETIYKSISTDTRTISKDSIFIALKGFNFNGNNYALEASIKGAKICIIDEIAFNNISDFNKDTFIIKVNNTKEALLNLAKYYRNKLKVKIIGITGSTGKTSTKDLVAAALSKRYNVFKTKGNFNNEIGLPLMIFNIDNTYDIAVLEMGMSNFGEIHKLADVARPDIGIITNIGVSHIEYLKTRENILKAKLEITDFFTKNNTLIVNGDDDLLNKLKSNRYNLLKVGIENYDCYFRACDTIIGEESIEFKVEENKNLINNIFNICIPGKHNILNSMLAIACARKLNLSFEDIIEGFKNLEVTSMRLDIIKGNKFTIIDDSYNASPDSMKAALDVLSNLKGNKKIAVLGTMKELGDKSFEFHKEVGKYAKLKNIDLLITIGEYQKAFEEGFNDINKFKACSNSEEAFNYIKSIINYKDVILIKASRTMKFETIVNKLKMINC
ncbi:UDP-N-acetylmuramoyl-tripeptide--D-alanyl-D-alanine ligase [Clostridium prolinivorans]|uniref:UDP-N-acetylmuramoyl-tripeptide--D-alanyl-D- alanine ligase n=1 Tax=Clostridium prolinivorans TaxID=2769420 RepID=UPI000FD7EAF6|nr:UDP-N-acetylmuramoyl-tripeptide--D-alanyl-D-alanine ligase [Clostridium prolinivorans]